MIAKQKILLSMGTRPEIIKMAAVYMALKKRGMEPVLLHTGQHTDMAASMYKLFGITPDYNITLNQSGSSQLACQSAQLLEQISNAMMTINPSMVLVHGDTSSALMAAMAAFYQQRPIAHIEAGLRSHHEYNPFPEEKNRVLIGQLAQWHFAPTHQAKQNLLMEGIDPSRIHVVGNTVVETARMVLSRLVIYQNDNSGNLIEKLRPVVESKRLVTVTMHRRENQESAIALIAATVIKMLKQHPDMCVVWPVHPNPKVENAVYGALAGIEDTVKDRLHVTRPLDYPVLLWILKNSWAVMTDSGGIQEEAAALHVPVLVLRDTTERPEINEAGGGILVGTTQENILHQIDLLTRYPHKHEAMRNAKNPFGDGTTAASICDILLQDHTVEKIYA